MLKDCGFIKTARTKQQGTKATVLDRSVKCITVGHFQGWTKMTTRQEFVKATGKPTEARQKRFVATAHGCTNQRLRTEMRAERTSVAKQDRRIKQARTQGKDQGT